MADPVELVRRLCLCYPPRLQPPQRSRRPRCLVRARPRLPGSPLSLRCRALDASRPAAVEGEQCEEYDDDEEPYFSVTSSRLSEVDYLGESTKGDLNVRRRHLDALGGNGKSTLHGPIEEIAWKEARQAETLLSDLGIADPLTVRHSPRGIFCTRTLNLRSISVIGYDMDYTLIHYNVMAWEGRAYDYGMANLKSMGFLVDDLEFDPDLVIRGLIMDKEKGNLVKADRFGYIKRVMHGTQMLPTRAVSEIYGRELVDLRKEDTWEFLNTLFSVSEAVMFMQMVDKLDQGLVPAELGPLDYKGLYNAVSKALFRAHVEGQLKSEIMAEPERFVEPDPELPLALLDQKEAGKRLLLITNSDYHYTNKMMNHAFNRFLPNDMGWRDLFEMVIVSARKPEFFQISHPLYEVVTDDGLLRPCFKANSGGLYSGGCAQMVEKSLDIHGDEILYVGDHIFTDVSQSKVHLRWRTALICRELEDEFDALIQSHAQKEKLVTLIQQKEIVGDLFNQLRLALQRRTNSRPAQTLAATCMNDQELTESMQKLLIVMQRLDEKIVPLLESDGELFNKRYKDHYCQVPMSIFYVTSTSNVWFPAYFPDQICSLQKKWRLSLISVKSQGIIVIFASYLNIFVISNVYDCHSGTNVLRRPVSLGSLHTL